VAGDDSPGVLWADETTLTAIAPGLAVPGAMDIVLVHGGAEWSDRPTGGQRAIYRRLAEAGAEVVLGSHPHVLQGLESHGGSLIAHSLGNFVFPGMQGTGGTESAILVLGVHNGRVVAVRLVPVVLEGRTVRLARGQGIRERVLGLSRALLVAE
jgi:poly-gamma-glutamate synthesis protein (capsule biosynthesis protein)